MNWITRERPKIDRIACPWLIRKFIDPEARFHFVPAESVLEKAKELGATPFDIPGVELTHYEDRCTFDYLIQKFNIEDEAVKAMAVIIRGADTDVHSLAPQSSGLWAISAGLAYTISDDHELLEKGMVIYDALYSWAKHLQNQRHAENPTEKLLLEIFNTYVQGKSGATQAPEWAKQLKEIIQDQIDTNLNLSLKEVAAGLDMNPTYVSREFSKYFSDLSFGEYIRKQRIEKAIELLERTKNSLAEIAYLTGFSDQSHFTRIFKQHTGQNPSTFRKSLIKR
jgi:AraC-like DNA-binding protein